MLTRPNAEKGKLGIGKRDWASMVGAVVVV